jgi:hypothetical protein
MQHTYVQHAARADLHDYLDAENSERELKRKLAMVSLPDRKPRHFVRSAKAMPGTARHGPASTAQHGTAFERPEHTPPTDRPLSVGPSV